MNKYLYVIVANLIMIGAMVGMYTLTHSLWSFLFILGIQIITKDDK